MLALAQNGNAGRGAADVSEVFRNSLKVVAGGTQPI
jgi:hypothetical protein